MSMMDLLTVVNSDPMIPLNEGGVKIIKSIQRGVGTATSIAISEVNPDKCIVLIDGISTTTLTYSRYLNSAANDYSAWGNVVGGATLASVSSDTLEISNVKNTYSWQLIEFY